MSNLDYECTQYYIKYTDTDHFQINMTFSILYYTVYYIRNLIRTLVATISA